MANPKTNPKVWRAAQPGIMERVALRDAFIPDPGKVLLGADFRQMELRIAAHYGRDQKLTEILSAQNVDVFKEMWAVWHHTEPEEVDDEEREIAKRTCYGILYGMGFNTLARELQCSISYAQELITTFQESFSGVQSFIQNTIDLGHQEGFVKTLSGRCRHLPNLKSTNSHLRSAAERQAVNTVCQGASADLMKLAMIAVDTAIKDHRQQETTGPLASANILMQIHDELLLQVDEEDLPAAAKVLKSCMENAVQLSLPMPVKLMAGRSWGSLEKIEEFMAISLSQSQRSQVQ